MAAVRVTLTALFLIIIGGWFIMNSLLPILDLGDPFSLTVAAAIFFLYFGLDMTASQAELLYYLFPIVGTLSFIAGILLLTKNGRLMAKLMLMIITILSGLALILCFALMGIDVSDPEGTLGIFKSAFEDGDLVALLMPVAEILLILVASILGTIFMIGRGVKEHFE
ncbi:MAG: hypothetical protein FWH44_03710 [Methanomassiliicoccaceae archaeon]|nr:hypothetical protein [Methanomassiliicoccaceae archaeon]